MSKKAAAAIVTVLVCAAAFLICRYKTSHRRFNETILKDGYARESFLNINGYDVGSQSCEDIMIPESFDKAYEGYAELQKSRMLPLSEYKGKNAKRYLYEIKGENGKYAELIICDDVLIAASILEYGSPGKCYPL